MYFKQGVGGSEQCAHHVIVKINLNIKRVVIENKT